ncbi:unnamed protein product [Meganyctiphanes norvegica]|uniref:RING-type domain-containing protein n=1 Tax=Meganyctiphanes norvegica TaxID=48144 RepID=A0AAV2QAC6_MEGNR
MDFLECNVCLDQYNDDDRRPHSLHCGHTYCSKCIDRYIEHQMFKCPTCRKFHFVSSANDFPPNYDLQAAVQHFKSNVADDTTEEENKADLKVCPHHNTCQLYFHCLTHSEPVCRECTVLRHPRGVCRLISVALENDKQLSISCVEAQYTRTGEACAKLITEKEAKEHQIGTKEQEIKAMMEQLKQLNQEHTNIEDKISHFNGHKRHLENVKEALMCVKNAEDLQKSSELVLKHLHETMQLLSSVKEDMEAWVVQTKPGQQRFAQLSLQDTHLYLHVLRDDVVNDLSQLDMEHVAKLPYSALRDAMNLETPLCFIEIGYTTSNPAKNVGRIHIRLNENSDRAQQFRLLCTGEMGPSYHNCNFTDVLKKDTLGTSLVGGNYDGGTAEALIPNLLEGEENAQDITAGLLTGVIQNDSSQNAIFSIYTSKRPGHKDGLAFGRIEDDLGLAVVIAATEQENVKDIKIMDCGVALFNSRQQIAVDDITYI